MQPGEWYAFNTATLHTVVYCNGTGTTLKKDGRSDAQHSAHSSRQTNEHHVCVQVERDWRRVQGGRGQMDQYSIHSDQTTSRCVSRVLQDEQQHLGLIQSRRDRYDCCEQTEAHLQAVHWGIKP